MKVMKGRADRSLSAMLCTIVLSISIAPSLAQGSGTNSFFGNAMPGTSGPNPAPDEPPGTPGLNAPKLPAAGGDYTDDEKRMQKKFKSRLAHDQDMISKGEHMMKGSNPTSKEYKKGKILKEIGERDAAELKANSPFPELPNKGKKKASD